MPPMLGRGVEALLALAPGTLALVAAAAGAVGMLLVVGLVGLVRARRHRAAAAADRAEAAQRRAEAERTAAALRAELAERDRLIADARIDAATATTRADTLLDQLEDLQTANAALRRELDAAQAERARLAEALEAEKRGAADKLALLEDARTRLADAFKALSAQALEANNRSFLDLAKGQLDAARAAADADLTRRQKAVEALVDPLRQSLDKVDGQIRAIEKERVDAYAGLREQVGHLIEGQHRLRGETAGLVRALRSPSARGRWGEIQLRRVVEMAGMVDHCDFVEQPSLQTADGARLRPDMIVRLPGGKTVVVDAKTPLDAYLSAVEAGDDAETRATEGRRHARQVRDHLKKLGDKRYWAELDGAPEFVVLFLPGEAFFAAALDHDPGLIEAGIDQGVIPATPTTLIALLRAVAYGWRQDRLEENARAIAALGRELFDRIGTLGGHMARLGKDLGRSVEAYNATVGALESRVLVSARRLKDLDAAPEDGTVPAADPVDAAPRAPAAPDLIGPGRGGSGGALDPDGATAYVHRLTRDKED